MRPAPCATLLALLVLALGYPSEAHAQKPQNPWLVHVAGGVYFPTGDYATTTNPGFGLETDIGYQLAPRWLVMATFNMGWLKGEVGPDWTNYGYFLKGAYDVGDPGSKLRILIPLGAGGVTFSPDSDSLESTSKFALNSGLMFQYYVSPKFAISFNGMATLVFGSVFEDGGDITWVFPITAGLLFRF